MNIDGYLAAAVDGCIAAVRLTHAFTFHSNTEGILGDGQTRPFGRETHESDQRVLPEWNCINTTTRLLDLRPAPSSARTIPMNLWTTALYRRHQLRPQLQRASKQSLFRPRTQSRDHDFNRHHHRLWPRRVRYHWPAETATTSQVEPDTFGPVVSRSLPCNLSYICRGSDQYKYPVGTARMASHTIAADGGQILS